MTVCSNCGFQAVDGSTVCSRCGCPMGNIPPQPSFYPSPPMYLPPPYIPSSYPKIQTTGLIVWSVILLVTGNLIFGIIALVFALQVNSCLTYQEAKGKYDTAKAMCIAGTVLSAIAIVFFILYFVLIFAFVFQVVDEIEPFQEYGYYAMALIRNVLM